MKTQREAVTNVVALDAKMQVLIQKEGLKVCLCGAVVQKFTGSPSVLILDVSISRVSAKESFVILA